MTTAPATARVHSVDSFGTVDGPGTRLVIFLQGCPLRCLYCHNPDTWGMTSESAQLMSVDEILELYERNRPFYRHGGITVTGGEPLVQLDFVIELFEACKERGIHTCLDTSGVTFHRSERYLKKIDRLIAATSLFMVDIKHIDDAEHNKLTGQSNGNILDFVSYLDAHGAELWVRHVVVPGITAHEQHLVNLGYFLGALTNLKALDVIAYHTMGVKKYESLGMAYPLADTPALTKAEAVEAKKSIFAGMRKRRSELRAAACS